MSEHVKPSDSKELAKSYDSKEVEKKWYEYWNDNGFFRADPNSNKPSFCIMIPPPNVTGVLHMGHALVNTLQDILIRWKRMQGFDALWVPGTDHAGISTQTVVERNLMKTYGKSRKDYSREEFLQHVWDWKEKSENNILGQLKRVGCSCDWSRKRFTMDEQNNKAVRVMFKKLFDNGLIYRGNYLVNWDPVTQTAIADDEVEYDERQSFLWHFSYPLEDGTASIQIATTRPETMLGDTAVAVSPKDERYTHLIGKNAVQPLTGRKLPIIADDWVDPTFGTGAVKITPAHDPNDWLISQRHPIDVISIMTNDGKINDKGGSFQGLTMSEAREKVIEAMKAKGHFVKADPYVLRVGVSYRSKAVIEPHLSKQWFVKMSVFKKQLREIVEHGQTKLFPSHWDNTYFHWIDNLRDWCISRQLWWGHRIPIWYHTTAHDTILCYDGDGVPPEVEKNPHDWVQDSDVLDTWFSSALWPFATLGWPEKTQDLSKYYPNSTLITGHDILFFWVARMILMGTYAMGKPPFPETFLHGLIYGKSYWRNLAGGGIQYVSEEEQKAFDLGASLPKDVQSKWEKMSKSKGNVIDPLEIIDMYGADAMRMALASSVTHARQIDLDRRKFEEFRNFTNKVWNGARFVFMNLQENNEQPALSQAALEQGLNIDLLTLEDHWILAKLAKTVESVSKHLTAYEFDQAANKSYEFFWNEFCAYYVEIIKPVLFGKKGTPELRQNKQRLLTIVLMQAIRLMHPMAPFITEELFQLLKKEFPMIEKCESCDPHTKELILALQAKACIVAPFPEPLALYKHDAEQNFDTLSNIVYAVRNIRGEMKIPPATATDIVIVGAENNPEFLLAQENKDLISALVKVQTLSFASQTPSLTHASSITVGSLTLWIPLPKELMEQEKSRLAKEEVKIQTQIDKLASQLGNSQFIERAPKELIDKLNAQHQQAKKELEAIKIQLQTF